MRARAAGCHSVRKEARCQLIEEKAVKEKEKAERERQKKLKEKEDEKGF